MKGEKTISELDSLFEIHPNLIMQWKKQLLEGAVGIFSQKKAPQFDDLRKKLDRAHQKLGQRDLEFDYLKKSGNNSTRSKKAHDQRRQRGKNEPTKAEQAIVAFQKRLLLQAQTDV